VRVSNLGGSAVNKRLLRGTSSRFVRASKLGGSAVNKRLLRGTSSRFVRASNLMRASKLLRAPLDTMRRLA